MTATGRDAANALEVRDLRYRYPDGTEALRGVSFVVAEGETVGLIGPNGAGKSTLLWHLNGLLPDPCPTDGPVRIFGQAIAPRHLHTVRRQVGLLFQDPDDQLFCPTVGEDVGFGPAQLGLSAAEVGARVRTALAQVGLGGAEARAPHHLSGGEKRRVCLAGILACGSSILVLDEPTGDLDPRGRRELKALLATLPATKLIASHDLGLIAALCARTLVLDGGRIVADGATAEVLGDAELLRAHGLDDGDRVGRRAGAGRGLASWLCLLALTAGVVVLPAMHAAVHLAERVAASPPAARPRIVVHRYQHCHGGTCHDVDGGPRRPPHEPHHHDGDRPGEHGRASPEHLAVLALRAAAPTVPPRILPAVLVDRAVVLHPIVATVVRAHDIRGPPRAQT